MPDSKRVILPTDMKLRAIEEKFNIGTWSWNLKTSELAWSPGLFRLLGMESSSVVPTIDLYQSLVHPEDQIDFSKSVGLVQGKRLQDRKFRVIRPDGSLRWLRSKAQPHFDRDGVAIAMFGVVADISDMQELTGNLEAETASRHALSKLLGGCIWRAYPDGKLPETTDWSRFTGQTPAEARDWEQLAAIHPQDRQAFCSAWANAISTGQEFFTRVRVKDIYGQYKTFTGRAVALRDTNNRICEWIGHSIEDDTYITRLNETDALSAGQIRAARAFLGWSASTLAREADVSFSTIRRLEKATDSIRKESLEQVRTALEDAGIRFFKDRGRMSVALAGSG